MITNRIGRRKVLLPINRNCYNFRKQQINLDQRSLVETMSKVKKIKNKNKIKKKKANNFGNSSTFFKIGDCCYGYFNQLCDWWIKLSGLCMNDYSNCPITGVQ